MRSVGRTKIALMLALGFGLVSFPMLANGAGTQVHSTSKVRGIVSDSTDRAAITELLNRHQIYIDLMDAERYADLYTSNGVYLSPFASATGHDEILGMFKNLAASGFTKNKRHFMGPIMVDIAGDRATAHSDWWVADYSGTQSTVFATGTYDDELQKINGVWRIQKRVQTLDSNTATGK